MTREVTQESFLKDVALHELTIIRDDGVHRHVRMKRPSSGVMHFDVITYPHHLVFSGDMGCYVFSRIDDMFEFFRSGLREEGKLLINEGYWSEKLEATDRCDGHKAYSSDRFRAYVQRWLDEHDFVDQLTADDVLDGDETEAERDALVHAARESMKQLLDREVLSHAEDHETFARHALAGFKIGDRYPFADSWEVSFDRYTYRFIWSLFAIVWTIREYDLIRAASIVGVDR